jgi:four helix bundle protein
MSENRPVAEIHPADQLQERFIAFAVRVIRLSTTLPSSVAGRHLARQMTRSGTSPAPNYGEARGAESRADFIHKLGIIQKELNETFIWLRVLQDCRMGNPSMTSSLLDECSQLSRIIGSSLHTARSRGKSRMDITNNE